MDEAHDQELEQKFQKTMEAIWQKYLPLNSERVAQIERAVEALQKKQFTPALRAEAEADAHKLAGAGGTMGYTRISQLARELEELFRTSQDLEAQTERIAVLVTDLRQEFEATKS
jgi:HPt (histidine-containing phosphotransfer) domain-containing protein